MTRKNKLTKFAELLTFPNVVENFDPKNTTLLLHHGVEIDLHGIWHSAFFNNDKPITLELACGRGEYSLALARIFPQRNFIGVDIKGSRIWKGAKGALTEGLENVGFLRTRIEQIDQFFSAGELEEIWITFPDPFISKENRRLTSPKFLNRYKRILAKGGQIHLKTDDDELYQYSIETVNQFEGASILYSNDDIYASELYCRELEFKTYYENLHLEQGKTIKYLRFTLG